jgi:ATP-dependent Clp protease ATP-binding subunit ClpA
MKRAIQRLLLDPLSEEILSGRVLPGETVLVQPEGDHLHIVAKKTVGAMR